MGEIYKNDVLNVKIGNERIKNIESDQTKPEHNLKTPNERESRYLRENTIFIALLTTTHIISLNEKYSYAYISKARLERMFYSENLWHKIMV